MTVVGGAGEVLTFNRDGTFVDNYSSQQPLTGSAGGSTYELLATGTDNGRVSVSSPGVADYTRDNPNNATVTITRDGSTLLTQGPAPSGSFSFTCTPDHLTLAVNTGSQEVTEYRRTSAPPVLLGGFNVLAIPINARLTHAYTSPVAVVSVPNTSLTPQHFTGSIDWGDGTTSSGTIVSARRLGPNPGSLVFKVTGQHTYRTTSVQSARITVSQDQTASKSASIQVHVEPLDPIAYFVSNPPTPHEHSISLLMPAQPVPGQRSIREYRWDFLDDPGHPVVDNSSTRPAIGALLNKLASDPGNSDFRTTAEDMGLLPPGQGGGPLGIGGMSADEVRQLAKVWQEEFPNHNIPFLRFAYTPPGGGLGVQLTVKDSAGKTSMYRQNLTISRDCLQWGGSGIFGWNPLRGATTCDTYNGISVQFEPKRLPPDYVFFAVNGTLKEKEKKFGAGGKAALSVAAGVSLVITHGILSSDANVRANSVFLQFQISAGLGQVSEKSADFAIGAGWVGPPNDATPRPTDTDVNDEVNGYSINAGFSLGVSVGGLDIGGGFNAVLSPSTGGAGEEYTVGTTLLGAGGGASCAGPINGASSINVLRQLYHTWDTGTPRHQSTEISSLLDKSLTDLVHHGLDLGSSAESIINSCAGNSGSS